MKALTYQGKRKVKVKDVATPKLEKRYDILIRVTSTSICGSDLHLFNGEIPGMTDDYIIGHEPMGIVEEIGSDVTHVKVGDRVIIPFNVSCGQCFFCQNQMESQCDNANDNPEKDTGAMLGYSHTYGGFAGGQAELLRVPYGNFGPLVIPPDAEVTDEQVLLLSDVIPTAYWSVDNAGVKKGDTVIVLGCGPIGLMVQKFAWQKGAKRVIAVDHVEYRLDHARRTNRVETFNFMENKELDDHLLEITNGGAEVVIDCVGLDSEKTFMEKVETTLKLQGGGLGAFHMASNVVRKFGTIQVTGVYGLNDNNFPFGHIFERNVTIKTGQLDPTDIITHRLSLDEAEHAYDIFDSKKEDCIKVVLKP